MQSFFIGVGATRQRTAVVVSPVLCTGTTASGIPLTVQYCSRLVRGLICVVWTVLTTKEYPPGNMEEFERERMQTYGTPLAFQNYP